MRGHACRPLHVHSVEVEVLRLGRSLGHAALGGLVGHLGWHVAFALLGEVTG